MLVRWSGRRAPPSLVAALFADGIELGRGDVAVVFAPELPAVLPALPWIWLTPLPVGVEASVAAVLRGAYEVLSLADGAVGLGQRLRELSLPGPEVAPAPQLVAGGPAGRRLLEQLARAARTSMPVLITGETGTGKEICARLLHEWSPRHEGPFVPIDCAAIPNELMEAELFGYARGAFSGAVRDYHGLLAAADKGTVFLDEIDDTPLPTQVKLLRVLEDRVVSRLGENAWHRVDFRVVAATNRDLRELIAAGQFGGDLFERLAIVAIEIPPLRERPEDIPALVEHLMARYHVEEPSPDRPRVRGASAAALAALAAYPWPGNIRELRNVLYQALVQKRGGDTLLLSDLPERVLRRGVRSPARTGLVDRAQLVRKLEAGSLNLRAEIEGLERLALTEALSRSGGNAAGAAKLLGEVGRGAARDPGATVRAMRRRLLTRRRR